MPALASTESEERLARLVRVREHRLNVRQRELAKRRAAALRAEDALSRQRQLLEQARLVLNQGQEHASGVLHAHTIDCALMSQFQTWMSTQRGVVATEAAAVAASTAAVDMVRREESKARDRVRQAFVAQRKVEITLERLSAQVLRAAEAAEDRQLEEAARGPAYRVFGELVEGDPW